MQNDLSQYNLKTDQAEPRRFNESVDTMPSISQSKQI